jgi:hypothetical protein
MTRTRFLPRAAAAATLAGGLLLAAVGPAAAAATTASADVGAGSTGAKVGTATFTRTAASGGTETLAVNLSVPGGITESTVCLSAQPFTSRVSPGQCPYKLGATGTSASYSINLGSTYAGKPLYAQVHVVTNGDTAFAGWQSGNPFYGNVQLAAALADTTVPVLPVGGLLTAALAAAGLAGLLARRRRAAPLDAG